MYAIGGDARESTVVEDDLEGVNAEKIRHTRKHTSQWALTTESAFSVNLRRARRLLYGCTTTSPPLSVSGKTEYVWINFFGNLSFSRSSRNDPKPEPVPPAIEWSIMKP